MAISFIGAAFAASTSVTLPTHQAGDLILIAARRANIAPATRPGTYSAVNQSTTTGFSVIVGSLVAASSSEVSGTWTNAAQLIALVYRSDSATLATGGTGLLATTAGTSHSIPAVTLDDSSGASWVVGFPSYALGDSDMLTFTGMTRRKEDSATTPLFCAFDTNAGVASFSAVSDTGYSNGFAKNTVSVEVKEVILDAYLPDPRLQMKQLLAA